jgi:flagellum-specific ATP synthase
VEGDDMNEPIADTVRSIVDGHVVLSRAIAHQGHYPAIDVLASISRLMRDIVGREQIENYQKLITVLATYKKVEDLVNLGAYAKGSNPDIDFALNKIHAVNAFLRQEVEEACSYERSCEELAAIFR